MVGREEWIARFETDLQRAEQRRSVQGRILNGLRGVGKTLLLRELAALASENGVGLLLAVDELQEAERTTLAAINATVHALGQGEDPMPFLMLGAGLPSLQGLLAEATSYAESLYEYWPVDRLDAAATEAALAGPAAERGVSWDVDALDRARAFCEGNRFFVQVLGQNAWNLAAGPTITDGDVAYAVADARSDIDASPYAARWHRATRAEQRLLQAIAGVAPSGGRRRRAAWSWRWASRRSPSSHRRGAV